jgi:hypothetical protein
VNRNFKRIGIGLVVLVFLGGCQSKTTSSGEPVEEATQVKKIEIPADFPPRTDLGLIHDRKIIRVGNTPEDGLEAFNKEEKALAINELPSDWPSDLRASGWKGERHGFGMIIKDGRLVGALYTEQAIDEQRLSEILADYKRSFGDPQQSIDTPDVRYWFWMDANCSCAICATKNEKGEVVVAIGMGLLSIMEALYMSPESAQKDSISAATILQNRATQTFQKQ